MINRTVSDISKRRISRNLVASADTHDGPVIVKSNRNAGGWPERDRAHRRGGTPLVKGRNMICREVFSEAPPILRELRRQFGFDYGKFDYVMRDGEVVLFDAKRTPTYNADTKAGSAMPLILGPASGIDEFLDVADPAAART